MKSECVQFIRRDSSTQIKFLANNWREIQLIFVFVSDVASKFVQNGFGALKMIVNAMPE